MKKVLCSMMMLAVTMAVMAVPAKKGLTKTIQLANGTEMKATLVGDEYGHFWKTQDGKAYQKIAGTYQEVNAKAVAEKAKARRNKVNAQRVKRLKAAKRVGEVGSYQGTKKAIMILVNFSDVKYQASHDNALFRKIANQENFNDGFFKGSMRDYFKAQSRGQFEMDFDVVGPVTVSKAASYYGQNDTEGNDMYPGLMVCEAVEKAKAEISDWTPYDWNDDGYVDQVYVVYAGKGEADGGDEETIWPHAYDLNSAQQYDDGTGPVLVGDKLYVNSYACGPELNGQYDDNQITGIGVMCHEYSHCLGYPDFYDTDYSGGQGMGSWDLMDSGSYNGDSYQPAGYTSYERWVAGWQEPIELNAEDKQVTAMKSLQNGGESYIIYNKSNKNEYYLLENRQLDGWDESLPAAGLLILHCDYDEMVWAANSPNNDPDHQRLTVVPGDGEYQITTQFDFETGDYYDTFSEAGFVTDVFPQEGYTSFNRSYVATGKIARKAAKLFNANADGSYWIDSSVEQITQQADGTIAFNFVANYTGEEAPAQGDFVKVTEAGQIAVGNEYLLVNEEYFAANSDYDNVKLLTVVEVDIEDNLLSGEGYAPMTLGGDANGYSLKIGAQYLTAEKAKELKMTATESKIWTITSTADGYIVDGGSTLGKIQFNYNGGNARFLNYTSNQKPAVLYVKKTTTGIETVKSVTMSDNRIYTIDGRYAGNDFSTLARGLYIVNGKKVIK